MGGIESNLKENLNVKDSFFTINSVSEESPIELVEYFSKGFASKELKSAVEEVVNYENYESILAVLGICETAEEFRKFY